jgi:schlafen family protein
MVLVALPIDTARPVRTHAEQHALVRAVRDAPASEQETNWLEWKGPLTLAGRDATGRATIAKAVLGFANRDPDVAARVMGGCAYLLAGVSPGQLVGVDFVDAAQLEAQVATYVGREVQWRPDYVAVDGKEVMVVIVEPPRLGDHAHPVRKTFNPSGPGPVLQEGTVFVRHQASTDPATAADIDMLSRRAAQRPGDELEVAVRPASETSLRPVDLSPEAQAKYLEHEEARLLSPISRPRRTQLGLSPTMQNLLLGGSGGGGEYRSQEKYREEISEYLDQLRDTLPKILPARAFLHEVARLRLEVVNPTDTTFTKVRVEICLPPELRVEDWHGDARAEGELPKRPVPYGRARQSPLGFRGGVSMASLSALGPAPVLASDFPDIYAGPDGVRVEYAPIDVRPQGVAPLRNIWLVIDDPAAESIPVRWEATATNAAKRLSGTFDVPVDQPPVDVEQLMAEVPDEEG